MQPETDAAAAAAAGGGDASADWDAGALDGKSTWAYTREELEARSPSMRDGYTLLKQEQERRRATEFAREFVKHLHVARRVEVFQLSCILFHRFYARRSMARHDVLRMATACVFLALKLDDVAYRLPHVVAIYLRLVHGLHSVDEKSKDYIETDEALVRAERVLLHALCYDFDVTPPSTILAAVLHRGGLLVDTAAAAAAAGGAAAVAGAATAAGGSSSSSGGGGGSATAAAATSAGGRLEPRREMQGRLPVPKYAHSSHDASRVQAEAERFLKSITRTNAVLLFTTADIVAASVVIGCEQAGHPMTDELKAAVAGTPLETIRGIRDYLTTLMTILTAPPPPPPPAAALPAGGGAAAASAGGSGAAVA